MAYWNHFAKNKYKQIMFSSLNVGDKFRKDSFKNKRRRTDIICIKTGELSYMEERSKKEHTLFSVDKLTVSSFSELLTHTN